MDNLTDVLRNCVIFKNFHGESIKVLLDKIDYKVYSYSKDETIAMEGDSCSSIGIVLNGSIEIKKFFASGKTIAIAKFLSGDIFGEVIIFSDMNKYPSTIIASGNCKILFISKKDIVTLCKMDNLILNNFMGLLSNKILMLNKKLKNLSYETLRQKITSLLLENYYIDKKNIFQISSSRKQMAEELGIPRPSLSRELVNMKKDGLIDFHKNTFKILNLEAMEDILMN
ncbi:cyclic nucleotide-binding protein [Clostridium pasteurianum DSM 525 = ATCC 6013]|uniref:Cyclic nucleotide-binding protein n=1 Tax=Clostridium pasteurianum DSM 525 = ATCC 6013 TaxID=1262449 RepID=A0A0H3J4Y3_CLOPA|nr:Crp/Fnr family transcriptional regulator [Clostridium pasteurianum]AJA48981.1 cyclic nucleotide-binding protein [Clostridium pasteurianum DSM 525 = ATCC 6013]AJA52969.1 cyclic nucleotide-binding protein [Clostridium pasteurianum DSM 525 = ATCC 6013]AOZ76188.1 cAMP-binding protein [Clostridium pasteurianum DSM 525 = ATCC 6013]AOZ79984.1 cAMP-binding protein [Clostridium pasteurianum]ELP60277.1 cyclic nucleotide-binding protein [Clostridium pasteurianum DSM 525 = ATCC 6013]